MPDGKKRRTLQENFDQLLAEAFQNRVLVFDEQDGRAFGEVMAMCRRIGKPLGVADGEIAAIARNKGYSIATHNLADFADCGINLVDPFQGK